MYNANNPCFNEECEINLSWINFCVICRLPWVRHVPSLSKRFKEEHSRALNYTEDFNMSSYNKQPAEQRAVIFKWNTLVSVRKEEFRDTRWDMQKKGGQKIKINARITTASGGMPSPHPCSRCFGEDRGEFAGFPQNSQPLVTSGLGTTPDGNHTCTTMIRSRSSCSCLGVSGITNIYYNAFLCTLSYVCFVHDTMGRRASEVVQAAIL